LTKEVLKPTNNTIIRDGLEPFTQYQIQLCCFFGPISVGIKHCKMSSLHLVTTAEEGKILDIIVVVMIMVIVMMMTTMMMMVVMMMMMMKMTMMV